MVEQSASATIDHNQDRNTDNPLDASHSESEHINDNETESVQQSVTSKLRNLLSFINNYYTVFDVLMPLPSPLEEYGSLSLHPQEVESKLYHLGIYCIL